VKDETALSITSQAEDSAILVFDLA
jgi:hypothetical protein